MTMNTEPRTVQDIAAGMNWRGRSGETVTGPDTAAHLDATMRVLDETGWTRSRNLDDSHLDGADESWSVKRMLLALIRVVREEQAPGPLTAYEALDQVSRSDDGDTDSWTTALRSIEAVLQVRTGAHFPEMSAWAEKRGRSLEEIRGLFQQAAEFARQYGPAA